MPIRTVLVVDDSEVDRHVITEMLVREGYEVATVGSAEAAFVRIRESRPDLVLLDIVMPGQNGYEALRELARNKDTRDIPVIVCSSKTQAADVHYVTEKLGARSYIMKPVQRDELVSKIARIAPA
jgi:twitching motility two-component system response regulator PilH